MIKTLDVLVAAIQHRNQIVDVEKVFQGRQPALKANLSRAFDRMTKVNRKLCVVEMKCFDRISGHTAILLHHTGATGTKMFPCALNKLKDTGVDHERFGCVLD